MRGYRERLDNTTETVVAREERNREAKKVPLSPTLTPTRTTTPTQTLTPTRTPNPYPNPNPNPNPNPVRVVSSK